MIADNASTLYNRIADTWNAGDDIRIKRSDDLVTMTNVSDNTGIAVELQQTYDKTSQTLFIEKVDPYG